MSHRAAKRKRHPPDYSKLREFLAEHRRESQEFDLMLAEIQAALMKGKTK